MTHVEYEEDCPFCYQTTEDGYESADVPVIFDEGNSWYLTASLGHFSPGYMLLNAKDHIPTLAEGADDAYWDAKDTITDILNEEYDKDVVFFEHGGAGQSINHAHGHLLPIGDVSLEPLRDGFDEISSDDEPPSTYLHVETSDGSTYFAAGEETPEQVLREWACTQIGLEPEQANWRENPFNNQFLDTIDRMQERFPTPFLHDEYATMQL